MSPDAEQSDSEQRRCPSCGGFMPEDRGAEVCINCDDGLRADGSGEPGVEQLPEKWRRRAEKAQEAGYTEKAIAVLDCADELEERIDADDDPEIRTDGGVDQSGNEHSLLRDDRADAVLSEDREYRYSLTRTWDAEKPTLAWIMLNPSTADETEDDPTVRRCLGYAEDWGYGEIVVVNLFALRATDPSELRDHPEPVGEDNDEHLRRVTEDADRVVAAWGANGDLQSRGREVARTLDADLYALDTTKDGHPVHPLYQPADAEPEPWDERALLAATDGGVDRPGTERRIALVGCGAAKMVTAGPVPARDLYTSTYFAKKREFAQEHCHNWRILSAEHGAPCPGREIETYERHIDDVDVDSWARRARLHLWKYKRDYELVVLAGQKYIEPIRGWLDEIDSTVRYPFGETSGIGEQLSVLNSLIEDPNLGSPEDQREDSDGGRDDESTEQVTLGEVADD